MSFGTKPSNHRGWSRFNSPLSLAQTPIEQLCGYLEALETDKNGLSALVRATRDANVWNCPTQSFYECLYERDINKVTAYEGMAYLPSTLRETWIQKKQEEIIEYAAVEKEQMRKLEVRRQIIKALHDGGARSCSAATRHKSFGFLALRSSKRCGLSLAPG